MSYTVMEEGALVICISFSQPQKWGGCLGKWKCTNTRLFTKETVYL